MFCECGCGQRIIGRPTKKYSSGACRQRAYEKRVKIQEEAKLQMFTFEEAEMYEAIQRAVVENKTLQMYLTNLRKKPRSQWYEDLRITWDIIVDACYHFNHREKEEFPF